MDDADNLNNSPLKESTGNFLLKSKAILIHTVQGGKGEGRYSSYYS
jgi:hypothetical protein